MFVVVFFIVFVFAFFIVLSMFVRPSPWHQVRTWEAALRRPCLPERASLLGFDHMLRREVMLPGRQESTQRMWT